jgi:diguanylate cyclase (GGDEF)-like protein
MREVWEPSRAVTLAGSTLLLLLVGYVDYVTGPEIRVFPLYFLPLIAVSLRLGRRAGLVAALACAVTWLAANGPAGSTRQEPVVTAINTVVMLVTFAFVSALTASQRRWLERERALSRTDGLTGLRNTRGFYELSATEIARSNRYRRPLTLAYVDLDSFKEVNDRHGHARGDEVLVAAARALRRASRSTDIVGRLGGDEFALLFPETGLTAGETAVRKLQSLFDEAMRKHGWSVTASIGCVSFEAPFPDVEALLREADSVMYEVKSSGKNAFRCRASTLPPAR